MPTVVEILLRLEAKDPHKRIRDSRQAIGNGLDTYDVGSVRTKSGRMDFLLLLQPTCPQIVNSMTRLQTCVASPIGPGPDAPEPHSTDYSTARLAFE